MTPIFHGDFATLLLILVSFIIAVVFLTILWRIALALDRIGQKLDDLTGEVKRATSERNKA